MLRLILLGALTPLLVHAQRLDSLHLMVDAETSDNTPFTFRTFQEASTHFIDGTTVYIRPGVYWIDDPNDPTVKVGKNGREPFGLVVRCPRLTIVGMGDGVTFDAKDLARVFVIKNGDVSLEGITVKNGKADYGGAIANAGDLTLTNVTLTGNEATTLWCWSAVTLPM